MARLCRLCLETSVDIVNVFESYQGSPIASVLTKHFWFEVYKNDGLSESLCEICWIHTKTFHNFYRRIESRHKNYRKSVSTIDKKSGSPNVDTNVCADFIKQERSDSPANSQLDFQMVAHEEIEPEAQTVDLLIISKEERSDYKDYNDDNSWENEQSLDNQSSNKKRKNEVTADSKATINQTLPSSTECKSSKTKPTSQCDKDKEDAQIREFFTMKCDICSNFEYGTLREARKHYRKIHKASGHLTCCGKKFHRRYKILDHIQSHLNPNAYRCDQCGKRFHDKFALQNHIANHEPLTSRAFKCSLCSSSFTKAGGLKYHMQDAHASEKGETFPCDECSKIFRSRYLLLYHTRIVHKLDSTCICDICGRAFKTKSVLKAHMQHHSTTPLPKFQCDICGAWLKNKVGIRNHLRRHQEDFVICPICKKLVQNKQALNCHIRRVHGERRHQCTVCDKAFKTKTILREHIAFHTGEDLYNCPYCEKKFKSGANMYAHRKKAHFAEWARNAPKRIALEKTGTT